MLRRVGGNLGDELDGELSTHSVFAENIGDKIWTKSFNIPKKK